MKSKPILFLSLALILLAQGGYSQELVQIEKPITGTHSALAITYPEGTTLSIKFKGTERLPKASGEAKVERKKGTTEIEIELDEMKPATGFGGDYATYVLWVVSPEGQVDNAGEFILQGNRSKLNVSTPLTTFGLFVTAEPHFLVEVPSRFVVLDNTRPTKNITAQIKDVSNIKYRGYEGIYRSAKDSLVNDAEAKGETRSEVRQARVALLLAERANASEYATEEYEKARQSWQKTVEAAEGKAAKGVLTTLGHETVRLAVEAEKRAKERSMQAALDSERKTRADQISTLKLSIEKAETDAGRAQLLAKQKEMELAIEQAARNAASERANDAARRANEAEEKARLAEMRANELALSQKEAELKAGTATQEAERARQERDAARARMREALNAVVETRETARGIIINLPDILFNTGQSTLKVEAREKLSKVCGILTVVNGYNLSIEGHTDSVGTEDYNQKLSENRAKRVMTYLTSCGIAQTSVTSKGFGKTQPIAPNETKEGKQKNRRVEIVVAETQSAAVPR